MQLTGELHQNLLQISLSLFSFPPSAPRRWEMVKQLKVDIIAGAVRAEYLIVRPLPVYVCFLSCLLI